MGTAAVSSSFSTSHSPAHSPETTTCYEVLVCNSDCLASDPANTCVCEWQGCPVSSPTPPPCYGPYCARLENGSCGACQLGFRARNGVCVSCDNKPSAYTVLFCVFIILCLYLLTMYFSGLRKRRLRAGIVVGIELFISIVITMTILRPMWGLDLRFCEVHSISDFYTVLMDPIGQDCSHDVTYPLWTGPIALYGIMAITTAVLRPLIAHAVKDHHLMKATLHSLLLYPALAVQHTFTCGIFYYAYGYIVVCASLFLFWSLLRSRGTHTLELRLHWSMAPTVVYALQVFGLASITHFFSNRADLLSVCFLVPLFFVAVLVCRRLQTTGLR